MTPTELTITIKTEDSTHRKKFLLYEIVSLEITDHTIQKCLDEIKAEVPNLPSDYSLKITATQLIK